MPAPPYYASLPADGQGRKYVREEEWNAVIDSFYAWPGNVNAGTKNLSNLGILTFGANGYIAAGARLHGSVQVGNSATPVVSRLSLGNQTDSDQTPVQRFAIYESVDGQYFRGVGFCRLTGGGFGMGFWGKAQAALPTHNNPDMILYDNGYLGIGHNKPAHQLMVYGAGQFIAAPTDAGVQSGSVLIASSGGTTGAGGALLLGGVTTGGIFPQAGIKAYQTDTTGQGRADLVFSTRGAASDTTLTERMRITAGGYVTTTAGATFYKGANISVTNGLTLGTFAKAVTGGNGAGCFTIESDDAINKLQAIFNLITDPTATNRRLQIGCVEQSVAFRNVTICEGGGRLGVGTVSPISKFTVKDASAPYTSANDGNAAFRITTGEALTDESLLFGVHDGDYSWIQAVKPGTAGRRLWLNPVGGAVVQSAPAAPVADADLGNGSVSIWYDEANNRLAFKAKTSGNVVKTGYVNVA